MAACRSKPSQSLFMMACRDEDDAAREAGQVPATLPNPSRDARAAQRPTWATAEIMSSPPAPPITSFDPRAVLTKMEGTMDDGGRSPGTGGRTAVRAPCSPARPPVPPALSPSPNARSPDARPARLPSPGAGGALCSPGWGVALEPCECRQHRSRSSLLRRMPVRGEYTMAPKLQTEAGLGAGCGVLTHTAVQGPLASRAAPSTLGPRSPPWPRPQSLLAPPLAPSAPSFWCEAPSPSSPSALKRHRVSSLQPEMPGRRPL